MNAPLYRERTYRNDVSTPGLTTFQVGVRETDLFITASKDLRTEAQASIYRHRSYIENYIKLLPDFLTSLRPLPEDGLAPEIVQKMLWAGHVAGVGPMACVAGAMAEFVGHDLLIGGSLEIIVENGGDIFLSCKREIHIGIFAGRSPLSNKIKLKIAPEKMPLGICTSSGTVGPSLSFGKADAVCVMAPSATLADAAASQIGNQVKSKKDIQRALNFGAKIPSLTGLLIIVDEHMGAWGDIVLS